MCKECWLTNQCEKDVANGRRRVGAGAVAVEAALEEMMEGLMQLDEELDVGGEEPLLFMRQHPFLDERC